jgi:hypothetical protein
MQLLGIGCALFAIVAASPWIIRTSGYIFFITAAVASGLLTVIAARIADRVPVRAGLLIVFSFALAMRLLLVGEGPFLSTDVYRYVWDGRVQAAGINPYLYVPADPALAALRDAAIYPNINRADYAVTAYPPIAEMFFFLVTRIGESITVMRLAMVGCELVIVAVLIDLLRRLARPLTGVVAYAWHPLAIWEVANSGHVEALMVALMMCGVWLLVRGQRVAGAVAGTFAMLVKPYALLVLPAFWRRWDWRVPAAIIGAIVLCYLPYYLGAGTGVLGFLTSYLGEEGITSGEGIWLVFLIQTVLGKIPGLAVAYALIAAIIMVCLAWRVSGRDQPTPNQTIGDIILLLTTGLFLMSPNFAWYFLVLVPFIVLGAGAPVWALTLGGFLLYRPLFLPYNDLLWKTLATLPFVLTLMLARRSSTALASIYPQSIERLDDATAARTSVVIPCLNEEEAIPGVVREVLAQGIGEVIVVDNGSTDATAARARAAGARVVAEPHRGYGRACAAGVHAVSPDKEFVCLLDGDGSDVPSYLANVIGPVSRGEADFVMGSRLRGRREQGSMTPQQLVAGYLAGALMRLVYGARFTDMSPFRAMRTAQLRQLGMTEETYGWNLEMQMRATAAGLRIREVPVAHRVRRGGVSKVSGNFIAGLSATWKITTTFARLALTLRSAKSR